jgi:hypothetical protein
MSTTGSKPQDEDENTRVARHILAALRDIGVEAHLVENIDDAPPTIPDQDLTTRITGFDRD